MYSLKWKKIQVKNQTSNLCRKNELHSCPGFATTIWVQFQISFLENSTFCASSWIALYVNAPRPSPLAKRAKPTCDANAHQEADLNLCMVRVLLEWVPNDESRPSGVRLRKNTAAPQILRKAYPDQTFFGKTLLFFRYSGVNAANLQAKRR